jgi:hypothetical protein
MTPRRYAILQSITNLSASDSVFKAGNIRNMADAKKKVQLSYIIPVQTAIRDSVTRNWSVIGIIDYLHIPNEFPSFIASFVAFGKLENIPDGTVKAEIKLIYEDGSVVDVSKLSGEVQAGSVEFAASFNNVKFDNPGRYHFDVEFNSVRVPGGDKFYFQVVKDSE